LWGKKEGQILNLEEKDEHRILLKVEKLKAQKLKAQSEKPKSIGAQSKEAQS
jgi:hypothetical protein